MQNLLEKLRQAREEQKGFTLIELLIVIVVLGVLAGIVVFSVAGINDNSARSACKSDVKTVEVAVEAFYAASGTPRAYPANIGTLVATNFLHSAPESGTYSIDGATGVVTRTPACPA